MHLRELVLLLALLPLAAPPAPAQGASAADTARYLIISNGSRVGYLKEWTEGADRHAEYEYNDRGRGPRLVERVRVNEQGLPTAFEVNGHNYMKEPVAERFSVDSDSVRWTNSVEGSASARAAGGFYVTIDGTPTEAARLARALLAAPGRRLTLLPAGEASIEKVEERSVRTNGEPRTLVHYRISGLGFAPWSLWMDPAGERFASVSSWRSIVPEGWEAAIPELLAAEDAAGSAYFERLAHELAHRPTGLPVIRNARLFVAESASVRPQTTVVVVGNRIQHVGPDGQMKLPPDAQVIDAKGKMLLPGLWDMHAHIAPGHEPLLHVAAGVTSARDMGNDTTDVLGLRRRFAGGAPARAGAAQHWWPASQALDGRQLDRRATAQSLLDR